jgi:transposase-like protein
MSDFKWRHFQGEIILQCVRWYCKYGISYRDLEEMMEERGVDVDHTTIYRWVQHYAPEIEKRLRWYYRPSYSTSWQIDETYVKVKGEWKYLYRAIDKDGRTLDFFLSHTRSTAMAKRFLCKALRKQKSYDRPETINIDKNPAYGNALKEMKNEGKCDSDLEHRQVKYLNNRLEADHGKLKRLIKPVRGFKSMKTAYATIKGFEVMRMFRKGQMRGWQLLPGIKGEVYLIEKQFGLDTKNVYEEFWKTFNEAFQTA